MHISKYLSRQSLIIVAITFAAHASLALSLTQREMEFRYVPQDKFSLDCGRMCEGWIIAEGVITNDTPRRFTKFVDEGKVTAQTIYFNSAGGSIAAAVKLASIIRAYTFQTALGRIETTPHSGNQKLLSERFREYVNKGLATDADRDQYFLENQMIFEHAVCYDACVIAFLGGVGRSVYPGSSIGFMGDRNNVPIEGAGSSRNDQDELRAKVDLRDFVTQMGADARLIDIASEDVPRSMHFLSPTELSDLHITYDPMQPTQTDWVFEPYFGGSALVASEQVLPYAAKQPSKNTITIYCLWSRPKFYVFQLQSFSEVIQSMGDAEDKDGAMLALKVSIGDFEVEREKIRFFYSHRDSEGSEITAILVDKKGLERALEDNTPMKIKAEFPPAWGVKIDSQLKTEGIKTKLSALSKACVK